MSDNSTKELSDTNFFNEIPIVERTISLWTMLPGGKLSKNLMVFFKTEDNKIYYEDFPNDNHNILGFKLRFLSRNEYKKTQGCIDVSDIIDITVVKKKNALKYISNKNTQLIPCNSFQKKFCDTVYAIRLKDNSIYFIQALKNIFLDEEEF